MRNCPREVRIRREAREGLSPLLQVSQVLGSHALAEGLTSSCLRPADQPVPPLREFTLAK